MTCEVFRALWDAEMEDSTPECAAQTKEHLESCENCAVWLDSRHDTNDVGKLLRFLGPRAFRTPNDPSTS